MLLASFSHKYPISPPIQPCHEAIGAPMAFLFSSSFSSPLPPSSFFISSQFSPSRISSVLARSSFALRICIFTNPAYQVSVVSGVCRCALSSFVSALSSHIHLISYLFPHPISLLPRVLLPSLSPTNPLSSLCPHVPSSFVVLPLWTYSCPFLLSSPILVIYTLVPSHLALTLSKQSILSHLSIASIPSHFISSRSINLFSLDSIAVRDTHHLALSAHVRISASILCNCTPQLSPCLVSFTDIGLVIESTISSIFSVSFA